MNHRIRWGIAVVALFSASIGTLALGPGAANAASCSGGGCDGKNPVTHGCASDAKTVRSHVWSDHAAGGTFGQQVIKLRHSAHCKAFWAQVTTTAGGTAHVTSGQAYMSGFKPSTVHNHLGPGTVYSNMRADIAVSACGRANFNGGTVIAIHCV